LAARAGSSKSEFAASFAAADAEKLFAAYGTISFSELAFVGERATAAADRREQFRTGLFAAEGQELFANATDAAV
jgi:hypothetical protein